MLKPVGQKKKQIIINHITFFEELEFCIPIFKSIFKYINMIHKYVPRGI